MNNQRRNSNLQKSTEENAPTQNQKYKSQVQMPSASQSMHAAHVAPINDQVRQTVYQYDLLFKNVSPPDSESAQVPHFAPQEIFTSTCTRSDVPHATFTQNPATNSQKSPALAYRFQCREIGRFAKELFTKLLNYDREVHKKMSYRDAIIPKLNSENAVLKSQVDELIKQNEKLMAEKQDLAGIVTVLQTEVAKGQTKVSTLENKIISRDEQVKELNKEIGKVKEKLETNNEKMDKIQLNSTINEGRINNVREQNAQLKKKATNFKNLNMKNKDRADKLANSNATLAKEVQDFKKIVRNREVEIDNLGTEVKLLEDEVANHKKEAVALKEYIANLEASKKNEVQVRRKLEEACPDFISNTLEKSTIDVIAWIEKRKRRFIERTTPTTATNSTIVTDSNLAANSSNQPQNGDSYGAAKKKQKTQEGEKNRCGVNGNTVVEEIWLNDNCDVEVALNKDQSTAISSKKMAVAQWMILQQQSSGLENAATANSDEHSSDGNARRTHQPKP